MEAFAIDHRLIIEARVWWHWQQRDIRARTHTKTDACSPVGWLLRSFANKCLRKWRRRRRRKSSLLSRDSSSHLGFRLVVRVSRRRRGRLWRPLAIHISQQSSHWSSFAGTSATLRASGEPRAGGANDRLKTQAASNDVDHHHLRKHLGRAFLDASLGFEVRIGATEDKRKGE